MLSKDGDPKQNKAFRNPISPEPMCTKLKAPKPRIVRLPTEDVFGKVHDGYRIDAHLHLGSSLTQGPF